MATATSSTCPKCQAANPSGAKFCAGCRNPLALGAAAAAAGSPPPVAPPTTPLQGLMAPGGKATTQNFAVSAEQVRAHLIETLTKRDNTELTQSSQPNQLLASMGFKNWLSTGGLVIQADTDIRITPVGTGQSQVSVQASVDSNSTSKLWGIVVIYWVLAILQLGFGLPAILGLVAFALTYWLLLTEPSELISEEVFADLRANEAALGHATASAEPMLSTMSGAASVATQAAPQSSPQSPPQSSAQPSQEDAAAEDEVFERIEKLAKLKEIGAISDAEFDTKKAELLARI